MPHGQAAFSEDRRENRDEVHYRTRCTHADERTLQLLVVNVSPHGFMARCEASVADGDAMRITLPGIGTVPAVVRWALGGRIGCEFSRPIGLGNYYELLAALMR